MNLEVLRQQLHDAEQAAKLAAEGPAPSDYTPPREARVERSTIITMEHHSKVDGEFTGEVYRARVKYTVPDMGTVVLIGRMKTALAAEPITGCDSAASVVHVLSYLTMTLDKDTLPSWWKTAQATDFGPYLRLYQEVTAYEMRFLGRRADRARDQQPADAGDGDSGAERVHGEGGVGRRVQPPPERPGAAPADDEGSD